MRPKSRDGNMDGRAHRGDLNLDHGFSELLNATRTHSAAVAYERSRLAVPLRVNPIYRIFQHRGGAVVVFRRDEYKPIRRRDLGGPLLNHIVFVRRPARHSWRHGLVEEWHWEVAEVE